MSFFYQALTSEEIAEIRAEDAAAEAAEKAAAEGKEIGIEEGMLKERKKIAVKLHAAGQSIADIAELIEIPAKEVEQLLED